MSCEGALKRETEGSVDQDEVSFCARLFLSKRQVIMKFSLLHLYILSSLSFSHQPWHIPIPLLSPRSEVHSCNKPRGICFNILGREVLDVEVEKDQEN